MEKLKLLARKFAMCGIDMYFVGGAVRDKLMGIQSSDIDVCLVGTNAEEMGDILENMWKHKDIDCYTSVHGSFPIWIVEIGDDKYEFALARIERKTGDKHQSFKCRVDDVTIEEDLKRRDLTINAIAEHAVSGKIIDPYNGAFHIEQRVAHPVSISFMEDELRVIRAARFIARFGLNATPSLIEYCANLKSDAISKERIGMELMKLFKGPGKASLFFQFLECVGWLEPVFPELYATMGVPQSWSHHPEGSSIIQCAPFTSRVTGPAKTAGKYFPFRDLFSGSFAMATSIRDKSSTTVAQSVVNTSFDSFSGAFRTGSDGFLSSLSFDPAVFTKSESFVFLLGAETFTTDKSVRVMFKIPKSGMHGVMKLAVNEFEIFNRIIQPISIFMMDVFSGKEFSPQMEHHDDSVQTSGISDSWIHNIGISSVIIDFTSMSPDSDIICSFDLGFNSEACFTHFKEFMYKYNTFPSENQEKGDKYKHTFYGMLKMGDVFTHTMHCIDACKEGDWFTKAVMLCHDLGKVSTTTINGIRYQDILGTTVRYSPLAKISAVGHEEAGVEITRAFLKRIHFCSHREINQMSLLVKHHMIRAFYHDDSAQKVVRRTLRELLQAGLNYNQLVEVVRCDLAGRPPLEPIHPEIGQELAKELVDSGTMTPIVTGKLLLENGFEPSPLMGEITARALELQDRGILRVDNWQKVLHGSGFKNQVKWQGNTNQHSTKEQK